MPAGNPKNQKVVDAIANDLSNIRTGDVIGRGNDMRCCKISFDKSGIVSEPVRALQITSLSNLSVVRYTRVLVARIV